MNKQLILAATAVLLACSPLHAEQMWPFSSKKKKAAKVEKTDSVKKEDKFDKAVKGARKGSGLFDYYLTKTGELLLAVTPRNLKASYLLANRISEISQNSNFVAGQMLGDPFMIRFSADTSNVYLHKVNHWERVAPNDPIEKSFRRNVQDPITRTFKIKASRNDTLLIDVTSFFVSNDKLLTPIRQSPLVPGEMSATYDAAGSKLKEVKVFEKNLEITSILNYNSEPDGYTVTVRRSILELPEEPMKVRWQDNRVGYFSSKYYTYTSSKDKLLTHEMIHRWRIEPKEGEWEKYFRGELVEPERKIVFYVDDAFPDKWREVVKLGIEDWNKAFEAAGFKNVMEARDYPDDPSFDPDDIRYNCIRYAVTDVANAMGPSWDDPRTGEIITASVMVYHDIVKLLNRWRFLQTAAADPNVRTMNIPDSIMGSALRYVLSHEVGHCLGFMHNMASSAAIPVDSLRSPSFTQKYGTTYSIMDYARFNHVAQPGDYERGVSMMPPRMGLYDEYAVKWLYTYLPDAKTPEEEQPWLDNLVRSHAGDPIYRYGKQQIFNTLDPTSLSEDLGDDHVRASEYGIRNLKYIMKHLNEWYGEDDNDLTAREAMYKYLLNQYLTYINHVYNVKGGIMMNERKAGDPRPSYSFIDGDYQRRAQQFLIDQLHDLDWLDDPVLLKELPLQGNLSVRVQRILVACIEADKGSFGRMIDPAPNAYSQLEHGDDALKGIFLHTYQGKSLTPRDRSNQNSYVDMLLMITRLAPQKSSEKGIADDERGIGFAPQLDENGWNISTGNVYAEALGDGDMMSRMERQLEADLFGTSNTPEEVGGFGYFRSLTESLSPRDAMYYGRLIKVRDLLRQKRYTGDQETRNHYELLLHRIEGALQ